MIMRSNFFFFTYPRNVVVYRLSSDKVLISGFFGYIIIYVDPFFDFLIFKKLNMCFAASSFFNFSRLSSFLKYFKLIVTSVNKCANIVIRLRGSGFKVYDEGSTIKFLLGYSHFVSFSKFNNFFIRVLNKKNTVFNFFFLSVSMVFFFFNSLRLLRKFNFYNNKGFSVLGECVILKRLKD